MKKYYILTNKYTIRERLIKDGKVYDIVFRVVLAVDGSIKQKSLCGFQTKGKAKTAYINWIQNNCNPGEPPKRKKEEVEKKTPKLEELAKKYILALKNQNKESTICDKKNMMDLFVLPKIGYLEMDKINKGVLIQWQDELWNSINRKTGKPYIYNYLSKIWNHLNELLNWIESRYGFQNHLKEIKKPRKIENNKRVSSFWTKEEFERFLSQISAPKYRVFFSMLFYTGRRKGEILALKKEDIGDEYININKTYSRKTLSEHTYIITSTKNKNEGRSFIPDNLKRELQSYPGEEFFFFGGKNPLSENAIANAFKKGIRLSGVKRIRIHDLRHSFVSRMIHLGASPFVVAQAIGDNVEQIYRTYGHLYEEDMTNILKKL